MCTVLSHCGILTIHSDHVATPINSIVGCEFDCNFRSPEVHNFVAIGPDLVITNDMPLNAVVRCRRVICKRIVSRHSSQVVYITVDLGLHAKVRPIFLK